ncbi:hypothetical protein CLIM01_08660 [Colletotrichum limetticola]|uniref:DUF7580 domain-containing protein n=1 Tax=Colletotrichum limetticola TaxID=1209924 RepID=A0ABQ9PQY0_9PEZI|nr:hypothetical protein CLIM01_08660 [Colletotrichum limetticola]
MSNPPQSTQTELFFADCIEFNLISNLSDLCSDCIDGPRLEFSAGPSNRRNDHRVMDFQLRKALKQPDNIDRILDFDLLEDEDSIFQAINLLEDMCWLLDRLSLFIAELPQTDSAAKYGNLEFLIRQLETSDVDHFQLFSGPDSTPALFRYPPRSHRTRGIQIVKNFNRFLDQLPGSYIDPGFIVETSETNKGLLAEELSRGSPISQYQTQEEAAIKAIFSRFSICGHQKLNNHGMLVQLPTIETITSDLSPSSDIALDLFLAPCEGSTQWQEVQVMRVSREDNRLPPNLEPSICGVINDASYYASGLRFHMWDRLPHISEDDFAIPPYDFVERKRGQRNSFVTLRHLLDAGTLSSRPRWGHSRSLEGLRIVSMQEKKFLAIQILFGIVMCRRYGSTIATWDSQQVFFLSNQDEDESINKLIYASCVQTETKDSCIDLLDPEKILENSRPPPSRAFTEMARILLEIGFGNRLAGQDIAREGNDEHVWEELYSEVRAMKAGKYGGLIKDIDILDMLPYIDAADRCLRLPLSYRAQVSQMKRGKDAQVDAWSIVESIVRDQIISGLLQHSCTETTIPIMSSMMVARNQAQQASTHSLLTEQVAHSASVVALFDGSAAVSETSRCVSTSLSNLLNIILRDATVA